MWTVVMQGDSKKSVPAHSLIHSGHIFLLINFVPLDMVNTTPVRKDLPNWELQYWIFCVKEHYMLGPHKKIQARFHAFFEMDTVPTKGKIQDWATMFETFGTVENINTKYADRLSHLKWLILTKMRGYMY